MVTGMYGLVDSLYSLYRMDERVQLWDKESLSLEPCLSSLISDQISWYVVRFNTFSR